MRDFITQKLESFISKNSYSFYDIKRKLKEFNLFLDKKTLLKRIRQINNK